MNYTDGWCAGQKFRDLRGWPELLPRPPQPPVWRIEFSPGFLLRPPSRHESGGASNASNVEEFHVFYLRAGLSFREKPVALGFTKQYVVNLPTSPFAT
jgi:hypothetical protein